MSMDRAPSIAPFQSLAITPKPAIFSELNTATSKFNLTCLGSGGHHCCITGGGEGIGSSSWATRYSYSKSPAMEKRCPRGCIGRPKCWAFLRFHNNQAMIEKISALNSSCTCKNLESKSMKSDGGGGDRLMEPCNWVPNAGNLPIGPYGVQRVFLMIFAQCTHS